MPNRLIREGIITSATANKLTEPELLFFILLMLTADDKGRFDAHPVVIRAGIYPFRLDEVSVEDVSARLEAVARVGLVRLYEVDGKPYGYIPNFGQRVRIKRDKYPVSPWEHDGHMTDTCLTYDGHMSDICQAHDRHMSARREEKRIEEEEKKKRSEIEEEASSSPESIENDDMPLNDPGKPEAVDLPHVDEKRDIEPASPQGTAKAKVIPYPRSVEEVRSLMSNLATCGLRGDELDKCAEGFFLTMEECGWRLKNGLAIANWRATAQKYATSWQNNLGNVPFGSGAKERRKPPRLANAGCNDPRDYAQGGSKLSHDSNDPNAPF